MENNETNTQHISLDDFDKEVAATKQTLESLSGMPIYLASEDKIGELSIRRARFSPNSASPRTVKGKPNSLPIGVLRSKHAECPANHVFRCNDSACNSMACARWATLSSCCNAQCECEIAKRESVAAHISTHHYPDSVACAVCGFKIQSLYRLDRHFHEQHNLEGDIYVCIQKDESGQRCGHFFRRQEKFQAHVQSHSHCCSLVSGVDYLAIDILVFIAAIYPPAAEDARAFAHDQMENDAIVDQRMPMIQPSQLGNDNDSSLNQVTRKAIRLMPRHLADGSPRSKASHEHENFSENAAKESSNVGYVTPGASSRKRKAEPIVEPFKRFRSLDQDSLMDLPERRLKKPDPDSPMLTSKRLRPPRQSAPSVLNIHVLPPNWQHVADSPHFRDSSDIDINDGSEKMIIFEDLDSNPIILLANDEPSATFAMDMIHEQAVAQKLGVDPLVPPLDVASISSNGLLDETKFSAELDGALLIDFNDEHFLGDWSLQNPSNVRLPDDVDFDNFW